MGMGWVRPGLSSNFKESTAVFLSPSPGTHWDPLEPIFSRGKNQGFLL